jgi:DNA repair exonuclease SbcCD ATPase subunit
MEPGLIEQRLAWLEEQHAKAVEHASKLGERVHELEAAVAKVSRQGQELTGDVSRVTAAASRFQQLEDTLHKHRQEVARLLGESEERRTAKEKSLLQLRAGESEETGRAIAEIRMDLGLLAEVQQALEARREEELRITRTLDSLRKQLEVLMARDGERAEALASLEDDHRQEGRRSAEVQAELGMHRERVEGLVVHAEQREDQARRLETRLTELTASEGERQQLLGLWLEQQNLRQAEQDRSWRDWERRFQSFEKRSGEIDERILAYEETYRSLRQLRDDLAQLMERTERRINEVTEMQRLGEDRLKHDWTSFLAEDSKRWNAHKLTLDEQWREHTRGHEKLSAGAIAHEERLASDDERLKAMEAEARTRLAELHTLVRGWVMEGERPAKEPRRGR